jgi:hypothetical protein
LSKDYGIDGRGRYSKITWQEHYGSEQYFLDKQKILLDLKKGLINKVLKRNEEMLSAHRENTFYFWYLFLGINLC